MFTGIINHIGIFKGYRSGKMEMSLEAPSLAGSLELGESLAVNGVCLSLTKKIQNTLTFNLSEETLKTTSLPSLRINIFSLHKYICLREKRPCCRGSRSCN